ncbi:DUF551 domain-containing protein [Escherichia coli]|uniref:DUF551 domain-containing protein n=1 Tax=Escherichia coli TaxID=562 RepID=UPI003D68677F
MMHKSVAGEFQKEVDNTTVLLDDILSILALLEAGDWSEHCTKTELGGRLEREITRLIGDAQEATVTGYELIAEAWRLMDGQDPKTSDWHSKASKYLNSNIVEKVDDDRIEAVKAVLRRLAGNSPVTPDGWISCSERMPNDAQWCVVNTKYGYYVQCWSEGQGWLGDDISIPECDVINWMPLPEPPQEAK